MKSITLYYGKTVDVDIILSETGQKKYPLSIVSATGNFSNTYSLKEIVEMRNFFNEIIAKQATGPWPF